MTIHKELVIFSMNIIIDSIAGIIGHGIESLNS